MVGLQCSARDQGLRTLVSRFRYEKFQFTRFVTTKGETCLVVPFNRQTRPAQSLGKTRERLDRRWQMSKLQSGNIHHRPSIFCFGLDFVARMEPVRGAPCQRRTLSRITRHVERTSTVVTAVSVLRSAIRNPKVS